MATLNHSHSRTRLSAREACVTRSTCINKILVGHDERRDKVIAQRCFKLELTSAAAVGAVEETKSVDASDSQQALTTTTTDGARSLRSLEHTLRLDGLLFSVPKTDLSTELLPSVHLNSTYTLEQHAT